MEIKVKKNKMRNGINKTENALNIRKKCINAQ